VYSSINIFLKESNKYVNYLKKVVKKTKNDIDGITPLMWTENDKENKCCIKVEDTEQIYKPLLKHFDTFPNLIYSDEVASPFVKGGISFHQQSSTCKQKTRKFIVKLQLKTNNL
jgi:hypothetical protein